MKPSLLFLVVVLLVAGCAKVSAPPAVPDTIDFSYSGVQIVGQTILFTSNVSANNRFLWDFDDSTTSAEATPTHIYNTPGYRFVQLTVNGDISKTVVKSFGVYYDPLYTNLVSGARTWRHFTVLNHSGSLPDTTSYADTLFEVGVINAATIAIGNDTLHYYPMSDSVLGFDHTYFADGIHTTGSYDDLLFNHRANVIHFEKIRHISAGANSVEFYYAP